MERSLGPQRRPFASYEKFGIQVPLADYVAEVHRRRARRQSAPPVESASKPTLVELEEFFAGEAPE